MGAGGISGFRFGGILHHPEIPGKNKTFPGARGFPEKIRFDNTGIPPSRAPRLLYMNLSITDILSYLLCERVK